MKNIKNLIVLSIILCTTILVGCSKKVKSISLNFDTTIDPGEIREVIVEFNPAKASENVTFESSNPNVFSVEGNKIKGAAKGTATLTATSESGHVASVEITVTNNITELSLDAIRKMNTGTAQSLYVVSNVRKEDLDVTVTSSDESVIQVISGLNIKAVGAGTATVTVTSNTGISKSVEITVVKVVKNYTIEYNLKDEELDTLPEDAPTTFNEDSLPLELPKLSYGEGSDKLFLGWKINDDYVTGRETAEELENMLGENVNYNVTLTPVWSIPYIKIDAEKSNLLEVNDVYQLKYFSYKLPKGVDENKVIWTSSDPNVISVNDEGTATAVGEGYAVVTCTLEDLPQIKTVIGFTVKNGLDDMSELMKYFINDHFTEIIAKEISVVGYEFIYAHNLYASVVDFLFEEFTKVELIAPIGSNRPGTVKEKYYVTVHDTATASKHANAKMEAEYVYGGGGGTSWHYSVGNDGIYHQIPDNEVAYHAGDGTGTSYHLIETGVKATVKYPIVTISEDGWYELNGEKTTIQAPRYIRYSKNSDGSYNRDENGNKIEVANRLCTTEDINDIGIEVVIKDGYYYMGPTYFNDTYAKISNRGGNNNSIGIETCVNVGSDLYYTWQKTAKLVANLCNDNDIPLDHVKPHHFFSGKNCPQTMRDNGLYDNFLNLVAFEYEILTKYPNAKIEFISSNPEIVNELGRVINPPKYTTSVKYTIKITQNDKTETVDFAVVIPGLVTLGIID